MSDKGYGENLTRWRRAPWRGRGQERAGAASFPGSAARGMVERKVADETSASDDDARSTMATAKP